MDWLANHGGRPFFLFLHYYDPHYPYDPPPPFPPTYDGELAYVDVWIGKVMDKLRDSGAVRQHAGGPCRGPRRRLGGARREGARVLDLSEHAARPADRTSSQGGARGSQIDENVSLVDVVPTVLGLTGVDIPEAG